MSAVSKALFGSGDTTSTLGATLASPFTGQESLRNGLQNYSQNMLQGAQGTYNQGLNLMNSAASGNLPSAYTDNFNKTLANSMNSSVGSAMNNMAQKGIINSTSMSNAMAGVGQQAANAATSNFNNSVNQLFSIGQNMANLGMSAATPAQNMWSKMFSGQLQLSSPAQTVVHQGSSGLLGGIASGMSSGLNWNKVLGVS